MSTVSHVPLTLSKLSLFFRDNFVLDFLCSIPVSQRATITIARFKMYPGMKKKALERRDAVAKRKFKMTHAQRQERFQQLKNERLQREREEYESLTVEQKRRRDLRDEKRAKKAANNRKHKASNSSVCRNLMRVR